MSEVKVIEKLGETLDLVVTETRNPKEFFKDREGLYIWSSFVNRIVEKAEAIEVGEGKTFDLLSFKLTKYADDEQIEAELPKNHVFSESEVCAVVAELISRQPKGEEGTLENTGYANLFYTASFVVRVGWDGGGWGVRTWGRGGHEWLAGRRVFSPATDR